MPNLTLNIRMEGKLTVIVGGGAVALRKLRTLLASGATVRVVAKDSCDEIAAMKESGTIEFRRGSYGSSDLDNAFLVIAATDNALVNQQVYTDASVRGIIVSVADNPGAGDCTFPAVLRHGDLEVAVSTGGRCPTFAADVRDRIAAHIGPDFGVILNQLAVEREKLLTNGTPSTYNTQVLRSLTERLLAELTTRKE
jgi:precorrin-2 dehydrogenase / sirohydrochlorin ferrochelatase